VTLPHWVFGADVSVQHFALILKTTWNLTIAGPISSSNWRDILQRFMLGFRKLLSGGWLWTWKIRIFLENQFGPEYWN